MLLFRPNEEKEGLCHACNGILEFALNGVEQHQQQQVATPRSVQLFRLQAQEEHSDTT